MKKTYKLEFEKYNKEDILEIPYIYTTDSGEEGKSYEEIWKDYVKAYEFVRKKVDYLMGNLSNINKRLEDDFNELCKDKKNKCKNNSKRLPD